MSEMKRLNKLALKARVYGKSFHHAISHDRSSQPAKVILVSGVQRSGTNMFMNALERSWETDVYHEHDDRAFESYYMRDLPIIEALHARCKARFFVLKALLEAHKLRELKSAFPSAKVVWVFRNYADMINSHLVSWPGGREGIDEIVKDPSSAGFRGMGMSAETLSFVRAHFHPDMSDASALGLFWAYRNQLFFDQELENDPDTVLVRYEDLVMQPATTLKLACDQLGLPYSPGLHALIHSKSISKRASPAIDAEIEASCERMLGRLTEAAEQKRSPVPLERPAM